MYPPSKQAKNLVGKEWGLNPAQALWIFEAIIHPKITYGCLVWSHSLNQTNNNLLNRVQRLGLMGASHSLRSTPLAALETILGTIPIRLHISAQLEAARFRTRPLLWDRWDGVGEKKENGRPPEPTLPHPFRLICAAETITGCRMTVSSTGGCKYSRMPQRGATTPAIPFWPVRGML